MFDPFSSSDPTRTNTEDTNNDNRARTSDDLLIDLLDLDSQPGSQPSLNTQKSLPMLTPQGSPRSRASPATSLAMFTAVEPTGDTVEQPCLDQVKQKVQNYPPRSTQRETGTASPQPSTTNTNIALCLLEMAEKIGHHADHASRMTTAVDKIHTHVQNRQEEDSGINRTLIQTINNNNEPLAKLQPTTETLIQHNI